jgi:hypothetical protein
MAKQGAQQDIVPTLEERRTPQLTRPGTGPDHLTLPRSPSGGRACEYT